MMSIQRGSTAAAIQVSGGGSRGDNSSHSGYIQVETTGDRIRGSSSHSGGGNKGPRRQHAQQPFRWWQHRGQHRQPFRWIEAAEGPGESSSHSGGGSRRSGGDSSSHSGAGLQQKRRQQQSFRWCMAAEDVGGTAAAAAIQVEAAEETAAAI
jgi:hypothetical protein